MSVSNTTVRQLYVANGITTTFAIPYAFISGDGDDETKVYFVDPTTGEKTLQNSGYDLDPATDPGPPPVDPVNVVFDVAPPSSVKVLIERTLPLTQIISFLTTGQFDRKSLEKGLDRIVFMIQQLDLRLDNTFLLNILNEGNIDMNLPPLTPGDMLKVNDDGDGFETVDADTFIGETGATGPQGDGFINTGPFTAAENSTTDLSGEIYDDAQYEQVDFLAQVKRSTDILARKEFSIFFRDGAWELVVGFSREADDCPVVGVDFLVDPVTGQISAAVSNGDGDATIKFKKTLWTV